MTGVQTTDTADVVRDNNEPPTPVAPKPSVTARTADERTRLRRARDERGLSQRKLAELLDIPHDTLRKWDRGDLQQGPHYGESVTRLLDFFDLDYEDLWPPKAADGTVAPTLFDPRSAEPEISDLLRDIDDSARRWGRGVASRDQPNGSPTQHGPRRPAVPGEPVPHEATTEPAPSEAVDRTPGVVAFEDRRELAVPGPRRTRVGAIGSVLAGLPGRAAQRGVTALPRPKAAMLARPLTHSSAYRRRRGLFGAFVVVLAAAVVVTVALASRGNSTTPEPTREGAPSPVTAVAATLRATMETVRRASDRAEADIQEGLRRADAAAGRGDLTLANRRLAAVIKAYGPVDGAATVRRRIEGIQRDRRARERRRAAARRRAARRRPKSPAATPQPRQATPNTGGGSSGSTTTPPSTQNASPAPSTGGGSPTGGSGSSGDGRSSSDGADANHGFF